ncbi:MAG: hypothetical protein ABEJ58_04955 [Halodesulfurarchaeum sp.]
MKRRFAIALVLVLVLAAGCSMTSPAADKARQSQQTTTAQQGSGPQQTAPVQVMLPDGYDTQGIVNVSTAYRGHVSTLEKQGYVVQYRMNTSDGVVIRTLEGSGPNRTWIMTTNGVGDVNRTVVFQRENTRYTHVVYENGTNTTTSTRTPYAHPDVPVGNESLRSILAGLNINTPQTMPNSSYVYYQIDSFRNESISGGHFMVKPSGQIRVAYFTTGSKKVVYTSIAGAGNPVAVPDWVPTNSTGT